MAEVFLRFPKGRDRALTLSYDDGVEQDIRLIEIMNQNGLKGTFNINSGRYAAEGTVYPGEQIHRILTKQRATETYRNTGHEVAIHALTHPHLGQMPMERVIYEIAKDRENLEEQFGRIIRGMAYPYGQFSDRVVKALQYCGIAYARTIISTHDFRIPQDWLRLTATCHHKSPELMSLAHQFIHDSITGSPYLFYLWGHSYEFEADDNWQVIEKFSEYVGNKDAIWYATNIEVYDYIEAYRRLIFSLDGKQVMNPSGMTVWFQYRESLFEINPGTSLTV